MRLITYLLLTTACLFHTGCAKDFLNEKPADNLKTPSTIADYQAILDDATGMMNVSSAHGLGFLGADEFAIAEAQFNALANNPTNNYQKNAYTWNKEVYMGGEPPHIDWNISYMRILRSNIVIEGLPALKPTAEEQENCNQAMGAAYFFRALNHYHLAQLFCPVYKNPDAATTIGLPLRLGADVTLRVQRASLVETYKQIETDLKQSLTLLPVKSSVVYRPSKAAAHLLLAKMYMDMENYQEAERNSESCLKMNNSLIDFNTINLNANYPFGINGTGNPEVIFMTTLFNLSLMNASRYNASAEQLGVYAANDLRLKAYFTKNAAGRTLFKGSYNGNANYFTGLATDEVYLLKAECAARRSDVVTALEFYNALLIKRIEKSSFSPVQESNADQLLKLIIQERRKELVMRGIRWTDLRRFNKDERFSTTLTRQIGVATYQLLPNSLRYTWPLPPEAVNLGNHLQNPR